MSTIDLDVLIGACSAGGPSALSSVTQLRPADGPQAAIAPAKYAAARGDSGTYVYGRRYFEGEAQRCVLIDSAQSQRNRAELALALAIEDGNPVLGLVPRIRVTYTREESTESFTDLELPHRAFDAHIRAGTVDGKPTTQHPAYRAARDSSPANAWALFNLSPASLVFGSWDATRKAHQGRWPSAITGEILGVLADQASSDGEPLKKGGARVDPVGMSMRFDGETLKTLVEDQQTDMSPKTLKKVLNDANEALKKRTVASASSLGLGGIPPTLKQLGGVSCKSITRAHVLSFATLRQVRFGRGAEGDAALRAVLAAIAINGMVRSDSELYIRASCHLVEDGPSQTILDRRHGNHEAVVLPEIEEADSLLEAALTKATQVTGLQWNGQVFEVKGNPLILTSAPDESDEANS
ncbi:MAG: type I-U CRISPR-associated protein Cas7 [Bifidobacteriaceae bacterium]|nr:type I-U CRISPR-associated protein Cas7 [Bifidobacteriaceae bacterium]